jgi:hypothetical protein
VTIGLISREPLDPAGGRVRHRDRRPPRARSRSHIHRTPLDGVNEVFEGLKSGTVDGRRVLDIGRAA